jgi:glutamyl-tRNA reductase
MDQANFELINEQIKSFISSYQENPFIVPLKRVLSLHKRLLRTLKGMEEDEFIREMTEKMENAIQEILSGDESMLYSVDKDSYHILLWKLHQYLLNEIFPRLEEAEKKKKQNNQ